MGEAKQDQTALKGAFGLIALKDGLSNWKCHDKECKSVFDDVRAVLEHIHVHHLGGKVRCCYCKPAAFHKFSITSLQAHIKTNTHSELGLKPSTEMLYAQQDTINAAESLREVFGIDVQSAELEAVVGPRAYETVSLKSAKLKYFQ